MPAVRNLLLETFDEKTCYEILPEWRGCRVEISELSGGNTNRMFRVKSEKGDYSVRIYGDKTDLYINREYEKDAIDQMARLGISARLIKYLPEWRVTIVEFIDHGVTLSNRHFLDSSLYRKVTDPVRKMHQSGIRLKKKFNPMVEVQNMADLLQQTLGVHYPEFAIDATLERLTWLSEQVAIPESEYQPCHNDLVAENFILMNPGWTEVFPAPVYIIDWEYAGMAPSYYDLADLFQEIQVPSENERLLLQEYCQGQELDKVHYYVDLFKPFPDMYWFLWSLVQKKISSKQFDFYNYGRVKYENALRTLQRLHKTYGIKM